MALKVDKLLIIEDEIPLSTVLKDNLEQVKSVEVHVAYNGAEGLKKAKAINPDLILLDLIMPKMDGLEFLQALRAIPELQQTKVVVLSNVSDSTKIDALKSLGVYDYIIKSNWNISEVVERVRITIGK